MEAIRLAPSLTAARLRTRSGDAWLDVFAVLSFALSTLMALTVAGGIWMFSGWVTHPTTEMLEIGKTLGWYDPIGLFQTYLGLAVAAGGLLVLPIFSLGASAARLGARGRAQRLSSLRLVGVSGSGAISMSMVETFVQWIIGAIGGVIAYFLTLPLWANVSFIEQKIVPAQMRLPLPWLLAVLAITLLISLISTAVGLQRVRISPLGVARREPSPALKYWRVLTFVVALAIFIGWTRTQPSYRDSTTYITMAILLMLFMLTISLVGPFVIQLLAKPATAANSTTVLLAMRRILDDPRSTWRNVSAIGFLCFIAGFVAVAPNSGADNGSNSFIQDVNTGVLITLAFGFAAAALSTLMNQTSMVFDRAPQTLALSQVGFPRRIFGATRAVQVLAPMFLATVVSSGIGVFLGASAAPMSVDPHSILVVGLVLAVGVGLSFLALITCEPLERHVLNNVRRAND